MAYDIKGTAYVVGETKHVSDKFQKRSLIVEVMDGRYPQYIELEATGDQTSMLDEVRTGDQVSVTFNIRGRKYSKPGQEDRYFVSLNIWKLNVTERAAGSTVSAGRDEPLPF